MAIIPSAAYDRLIETLANIERLAAEQFCGDRESAAKYALVAIADIVPARLYGDEIVGDSNDLS